MKKPAENVVVHHSWVPPRCVNVVECSYAMRILQNAHMDDQNWTDIGYNFGVGADGNVYEGRGWMAVGAHAKNYNRNSVGLILFGDFDYEYPTKKQIKSTKELIYVGRKMGFITENHRVMGHSDAEPLEKWGACPGPNMMKELITWDNYNPPEAGARPKIRMGTKKEPRSPPEVDFGDAARSNGKYKFISRKEWKAKPATKTVKLKHPLKYVIIHHSENPPKCENQAECSFAMRTMQIMHQDERHWSDIGYNLAVGTDGRVYEGRGWNVLGAHAVGYNRESIGIVLIGNYKKESPPLKQIEATKLLIADGVAMGYLAKDHQIFGHSQVRDTDCPGPGLMKEIETWDQFGSNFRPKKD